MHVSEHGSESVDMSLFRTSGTLLTAFDRVRSTVSSFLAVVHSRVNDSKDDQKVTHTLVASISVVQICCSAAGCPAELARACSTRPQ